MPETVCPTCGLRNSPTSQACARCREPFDGPTQVTLSPFARTMADLPVPPRAPGAVDRDLPASARPTAPLPKVSAQPRPQPTQAPAAQPTPRPQARADSQETTRILAPESHAPEPTRITERPEAQGTPTRIVGADLGPTRVGPSPMAKEPPPTPPPVSRPQAAQPQARPARAQSAPQTQPLDFAQAKTQAIDLNAMPPPQPQARPRAQAQAPTARAPSAAPTQPVTFDPAKTQAIDLNALASAAPGMRDRDQDEASRRPSAVAAPESSAPASLLQRLRGVKASLTRPTEPAMPTTVAQAPSGRAPARLRAHVAAVALDGLLVAGVMVAIAYLDLAVRGHSFPASRPTVFENFAMWLSHSGGGPSRVALGTWAFTTAYAILGARTGLSLGRAAMRLTLVAPTGRPVDWAGALWHAMGCTFCWLSLGAGVWWMGVDRSHRSWASLLSRTQVVPKT